MFLIVGLGNPGKKYEKTSHNIGFLIIDKIKEKNNFPDFQFSKKFIAEISKGEIAEKKIILAKPQTFMNNSGLAVKKIVKNLNIKIENLILIHDDIDLPLGKIKISRNRGSAGHKGVESVIKELKTKDFTRFRIGIQPESGKPKNIDKFVLQKFAKNEGKILKEIIKETINKIEEIIKK